MLKMTTLRDIFLVVVALLFLPYESRVFMFDTRPEDWYGEIVLARGDQSIILAKNSGDKKINLDVSSIRQSLQKRFDQQDALEAPDRTVVLPLSYALLIADAEPKNTARRRANLDGTYFFSPGPLAVCTRSDYYVGFALVSIVMVCFILLTYVVSAYINEKSGASADKEAA